jgi:ABC-2 type transport system permease protein
MKIFHIAWKDVVIRLRDRRGLLTLFLMPIVLTLILGAVFGSSDNGMPKMTVAVANLDGGDFSKGLVNDVLQSDALREYVTLKTFDSEQAAADSVANGDADAGLYLPAGFTDSIRKGEPQQVKVLQDPGKHTIAAIMRSVVTSYTNRVSVVAGATKEVVGDLGKSVAVTNTGAMPDLAKIAGDVANELAQAAAHPATGVKQEPVGTKEVSGKQYYSAAMAVMFMLFNASIGAKQFINERGTETLSRLMSTPTSNMTILLGKFAGTLIFAVLQFAVLLVCTQLFFGVDWGANFGQLAGLAIAYAVGVAGLSMLLASLISNAQSADLVSNVGVQLFSVLGGSMVPLNLFPDWLQKIALIAPNTWALKGFINIMSGAAWSVIWLPVFVLLLIGAGSLTIGTWRLRAR